MSETSQNGAQSWLDDWSRRARQRLHETQEMAEKLEKLKVTATNPDGTVKVTVDSHGTVVDLVLRDSITSLPADRISTEIMATMRRARNAVGKGAYRIVKDSVGLESETGKAIMAGFRKRLHKDDNATSNGSAPS